MLRIFVGGGTRCSVVLCGTGGTEILRATWARARAFRRVASQHFLRRHFCLPSFSLWGNLRFLLHVNFGLGGWMRTCCSYLSTPTHLPYKPLRTTLASRVRRGWRNRLEGGRRRGRRSDGRDVAGCVSVHPTCSRCSWRGYPSSFCGTAERGVCGEGWAMPSCGCLWTDGSIVLCGSGSGCTRRREFCGVAPLLHTYALAHAHTRARARAAWAAWGITGSRRVRASTTTRRGCHHQAALPVQNTGRTAPRPSGDCWDFCLPVRRSSNALARHCAPAWADCTCAHAVLQAFPHYSAYLRFNISRCCRRHITTLTTIPRTDIR